MKTAKLKLFRKIFKYLLLFVIIGTVTIAAAAAIFISLYPKEKLLTIIEKRAEKVLQRDISIGKINYSLSGIVLQDTVLYDGKNDQSTVLAKVQEATLKIALLPLLDSKLNFNKMTFVGLDLNVIFDKDGQSNIERLLKQLHSNRDSRHDTTPETKISAIELVDSTVSLSNAINYLRPLEGKYQINARIEPKKKELLINDCIIHLPGQRGTVTPQLSINYEKKFHITGETRLKNVSMQWIYKWSSKSQPFNIVNGNVTNLSISRTKVSGHVNATSSLSNSPLRISATGNCSVHIKNKTVHLINTKAKINNSGCNIKSLLFTFSGNLRSFNLNDINLPLKNLKPILTIFPEKLYGTVQGDLSYKGTYNGTLTLIDIGYDPQNNYISKINETVTIQDNLFKKENIRLNLLGNPCNASVACTDPELKKIFLYINSPKIVIPKGQENGKNGDNKVVSTSRTIVGKISVKQFCYDNLTFSDANLDYSFSGNKIVINKLSSNCFDGHVQGNGYILFGEQMPQAFTSVQFNNIKVQNIVNLSSAFKNRFFGVAQGKANLKLNLKGDILKKIYGFVELKINEGKLVKTGLQNALGIFLTPIKHKLKDLEFKTIYGNISINGVNNTINSFIFNGHDKRLSLKGSLDQELTGQFNIFLEFNESFIKEYGPLEKATIANYKKGDWYVIPFVQKGDIRNEKNYKRLIR